jgi:putative DNA primase/helicase
MERRSMTAPYVDFDEEVRRRAGAKAKSNGHDPDGSPPDNLRSGFSTIALEAFMSQQLVAREMVVDPIISVRSLCLLFSYRGIGKTMVAFNVAWAVACGKRFLRWSAPKPRRVLYVDGEMPQQLLQERARTMIGSSDVRPPAPDYFRLLSLDRQELGVSLNLARREHQVMVEELLEDVEFVIFDNISTLVNGGPENDAASWDEMQQWLLQLRRRGITVLLIHHSGRGENARGTSKREDVLDTVIKLTRPDDYEMDEGARFEVHLTKARGITGDDALPFEARLTVLEDRDIWAFETLRDRVLDEIEQLTRERKSVREIAEETGIPKSKVNRLQAKLRAAGRIQ